MHFKSAALFALACTALPLSAQTYPVFFGTSTPKNGTSQGIYSAVFDSASGKFKGKAQLAAEVGNPGFLDLHPNGKFLYAACQVTGSGPSVAAYAVEGTTLRLLNSEPVGDGGSAHIQVHPSGKMLLTAQYGGGSVAAFPISLEGKVGPRSQLVEHEGGSGVVAKRQDKPHPHYVGFSPDGKFAFVPDLGMDGVVIYAVDPDNASIEKHGFAASVPGGGPRHMKFSVDGKFVYLLNELTLSVTTYAYDAAAGSLSQLGTVPALPEETKAKEAFNSASEIRVHPSGRLVFSANRGNDTVTAYQADPATGTLTVVESEPVRGAWPRNFNLDPSGKWLLAAGKDSSTVSVFSIDQDSGELTYQTRSILNVPTSICVLFGKGL